MSQQQRRSSNRKKQRSLKGKEHDLYVINEATIESTVDNLENVDQSCLIDPQMAKETAVVNSQEDLAMAEVADVQNTENVGTTVQTSESSPSPKRNIVAVDAHTADEYGSLMSSDSPENIGEKLYATPIVDRNDRVRSKSTNLMLELEQAAEISGMPIVSRRVL